MLYFKAEQPFQRKSSIWDFLVLLGLVALLYLGIELALSAPTFVKGPDIVLSPKALPWYSLLSLMRMGVAYGLSVAFTLVYGTLAARNRKAEKVLIPFLDVLQSVPILSFMPLVLLSFTAFLPVRFAVELAAIVLIFTSQVWNLTFAWYQSLKTVPQELKEASRIFRLGPWGQFKRLDFPFFMISFIWNSMMSWSGGWFFLMAAEMFTVGNRDFRLPGLGSYLKEAAIQGNVTAIAWGLGTLLFMILFLDQLVWRPLISWSKRFKLDLVEEGEPESRSWVFDVLKRSRLLNWLNRTLIFPMVDQIGSWLPSFQGMPKSTGTGRKWLILGAYGIAFIAGLALVGGGFLAGKMIAQVSLGSWVQIGLGICATFCRVAVALMIALCWTIPVGVLIGTNKKLAGYLQPLVQVVASIPATALFPLFLMGFLKIPWGMTMASVFLMLMGTQWYLLFNIIAGSSSIPLDLKYSADLLRLSSYKRWRVLTLPALFPFIITGAITASGGAWNASVVAEYVDFGGKTYQTHGIGSILAQATANGNYPLLLAATLVMILTVVLINRFFWRKLYHLAQERYNMG